MANLTISRQCRQRVLSSSALVVVLLFGARARAQCTMDTECKGDRICENGGCIAPPTRATQVNSAPVPQTRATPATAPPGAQPASASTQQPSAPLPPRQTAPHLVRHSKGMMVGGIVMVGLAPVALAVAGFAFLGEAFCGVGDSISDSSANRCSDLDPYIYGGLISAVALVAVGVPLLVVGAHREPASPENSARLSPWVGRHGGGLSLRFDM